MTAPTFRSWLKQQVKRDDRVGDVARDALADARIRCWRGRTPRSLRRHMQWDHAAIPAAVESLDQAAQEFGAAHER